MKKFLLLVTGFMLMASLALAANPCTVGPTGEVATIQAAITSWCAGGTNYGATPPFVVNIDPSVVYDEVMNLDDARPTGNIRGNLVLQSAIPGTKVLVKLQYDPGTLPAQAAGARDGLWVHQGAYNITFKDLIFIPSENGTVLDDDLVKCDENNNTTATIDNTITFDGCIFSDAVTSGTTRAPKVWSKADLIAMNFPGDFTLYTPLGSMTQNSDDLLKYWGDATPIVERMNCVIKDCVFLTKNARCLEGVCAGTTETLTIQDSLFAQGSTSYVVTARPYNAATVVNIIGTKDPRLGDLTKCTAVLAAKAHPIYPSGGAADPIGVSNIQKVLVNIYNDQATAARAMSGGAEGKLVEDSIFFVDRNPGNMVDYPYKKNSVYNRNTFHFPNTVTPQPLFYLGAGSDPYGIIMTDCSISGNMPGLGGPGGGDVGGMHVWNSNVALAGPDALTSTGVYATFHNCTFVDPMYLSKNVKLESFFDTSNPALALANSTGGGIGGGAHFRVPDASDEVTGQVKNILSDVGDCEKDLFWVASGRGNWGDPADGYGPGTEGDIYSVQDQAQGVIGSACWIHHTSGRLEAGSATGSFPTPAYSPIDLTAITGNTDGGTDLVWSFYYKIPTIYSSYPRFAIRFDPNHPPFISGQGEVGACAHYKELTNSAPSAWIVDNNWHLKTWNLTAADWVTGHHDVNVFVNNYLVPSWYLDEIYLTDPSSPKSGVADWGLF